MQTWGKIAAAVALLLLAGLVYYLRLDSFPNDMGSRSGYETFLMCRSCSQAYPATIKKDAKFPLVCEKCDKAAAWPQHQCYQCNHRFVPEPEGSPPHMPVAPVCPKCKSQSVGGVLPAK